MLISIRRLWSVVVVLGSLIPPLLQAQPNDMFTNRVVLTGTNLAVQGNNDGAGNEPGEDTGSANVLWFYSVWYEWSAPSNGVVHFGLDSATYNFIPTLHVYRGSTVDNLTPATFTPDGVAVTPGDTIELQIASLFYPVWGGGGATGPFTLTLWLETPQPASTNDFFTNRVAIPTSDFHFDGSLYEATSEPGEPLASPDSTQTVWFSFIAPAPGLLKVAATASQFSPAVAMYEGDQLNSLIPVPAISGSPLAFNLTGGHLYALQLSSRWAPVAGFALDTRFLPLANDAFTNSLQLEGATVSTIGDNRLASLEPGETLPLPESAGHTLWYSWAAPFSGVVAISSGSCCMNRAMAVYTGPDLGHLERIAAQQDSLYFLVDQGTVYYLQVDGAAGGMGEFSVSISATAFQSAPNDAFEHATVTAGYTAPAVAFVNDATLEPEEPNHRDGAPCKSLWWSWQAPKNGRSWVGNYFSLATNLSFAVYTGSSIDTLTLVGKGFNSAFFEAVGGTVYHIALVADVPTRGDAGFAVFNNPISGTPSISVPGNLLLEPSFEGTGLEFTHWQLSSPSFGGGYVGERGGADGVTWIVLISGISMWQDFATIPGRNYQVGFAIKPEFWASEGKVRVLWDNQEIGVGQTAATYWNWTNFIVTASNVTSRLTVEVVEGALGLDGFSVVPSAAPPVIITQPASASTFAGASASFRVGASGSEPLGYQWYFNNDLLTNQTLHTVSIDNVSRSQAGQYLVVVTNAFGSVTSSPALLVVEAPTSPTIVLQPDGQTVPPGGYVVFSVAAVGTPPLFYQWFFNGTAMAATNRQLIFPSVNVTNAGTYSVKVWNSAETVWSLPVTLMIDTNVTGGGAYWFANEIPDGGSTNQAPVFDTDGITKLNGAAFVAQLYAGPDLARIRPVGEPRPFRTGFSEGLIDPVAVELPNVAPSSPALVQVRVWQSSKGASYEEARALGSKFGKSEILQTTAGIMPHPPPLWGLQSFSLQAGLPQFFTGRIDFVGQQQDGTFSWSLVGQANYRYVVERSLGDLVWRPFLVLTNAASGIVIFTDTNSSLGISLYRARILE